MKTIQYILLLVIFLAGSSLTAQMKTDSFMVCGTTDPMSKSSIEKAGTKNKAYSLHWNAGTKMAYLKYDMNKVNPDQVKKQIALAGFDNDKYLAPDEVYAKLPECCRYERVNKKEMKSGPAMQHSMETMSHHPSKSMDAKTEAGTLKQADQLKPVFDLYFELKDALVNTDATAAALQAGYLLSAIDAVKMEALSAAVHTLWMKQMTSLKSDADKIFRSKDISKQRDYFMALSTNMYELMKVSKTDEPVYYQFCPMANDGKGANWLSRENAIKNPYYGVQMMTCGRTVETIKS